MKTQLLIQRRLKELAVDKLPDWVIDALSAELERKLERSAAQLIQREITHKTVASVIAKGVRHKGGAEGDISPSNEREAEHGGNRSETVS